MKMDEAKRHSMTGEPGRIVTEVLEAFQSSGIYLRDHVARLAELATSEDRETSEQATGAFFTSLVERLADSFEPRAATLYNRAFAQLIQHCRGVDRSGAFHAELTKFGLATEREILSRAESLRQRQAPAWLRQSGLRVRRIIVLSRVTLGADVAITSVMIERMKRAFPRAGVTLVGGRKAVELFGGDARLSFKEISYLRAGATLERLHAWVDVLGCVREMTCDLRPDQFLIADPDSRLTQLGMLPLSGGEAISDKSGSQSGGAKKQPEDKYLFFPSREYRSDTSQSLAQLTSAWLDDLFGFEELTYPQVSLAPADLEVAGEVVKRIKRAGRPVVSINFGVGENPLKRVGDDFETRLVNELLQEGSAIIFDKGAGEDETRRANNVIGNAARIIREGRPVRVIEIDEENLRAFAGSDEVNADLIVWSGRIGMLAALISESDLYIGYDSAGQHIAAALGVPSIDVFAGFSSPRMLDRWRPTGKAESRVVAVDKQAIADTHAILSDVLRHAKEMLKSSKQ